MPASRPKVLFITGAGRSGTTLLNRLLGQIPGFFAAGELNYLWDAGYGRNQVCACGTPLRECEFWGPMALRLEDGQGADYLNKIAALRSRVGFRNQLPRLLFPALQTRAFGEELSVYREAWARFFDLVSEQSKASVIVDSSKDPAHGLVLSGIDSIDVYVVHLVRNPYAVAYSRMQSKLKTSITDRDEYMPVSGPVRSSLKWVGVNRLAAFSFRHYPRYMRVRYEDLTRETRAVLEAIAGFVDEPTQGLGFLDGQQARLESTHTALGNPSKSSAGVIQIKADDRWRDGMSATARTAVGLCTLLSARKFGYVDR